jgi:predicted dinucleotide-binding enzyme
MRIGILGSGLMGGKLGTIFARAGHEVVFSYARHPEKLERLARDAGDAGGTARAGTPQEAAQNADALLLAVHWSRIDDLLAQAGDLSGKVIVTCSLPMNADDTGLVLGHTTSGAEELAKKVAKARVVCAFNTVTSEVLFGVYEGKLEGRPSLVYCGDDAGSKEIAAELIRDAGFAPVDAGPLRIARYTEPFALLVAQLAYEGEGGPELAYRFEWLGEPA